MCLIVFSWQKHARYPLIVAANRDEFYARPTEQAARWQTEPVIVAGKDLTAKGTWLGVTNTRRFAALTNYRDLKNLKAQAPSRGELTTNFLKSDISPQHYLEKLQAQAAEYNGFNLLVGTENELYYFSNYENKIRRLEAGLYGLSNHLLDTEWFKVRRIKQKFEKIIQTEFVAEDLFEMLYDQTVPPDPEVQQTGLRFDREKMLSSMFIQSPDYGTCCSTVVLFENTPKIHFWERTYNTPTHQPSDRSFVI